MRLLRLDFVNAEIVALPRGLDFAARCTGSSDTLTLLRRVMAPTVGYIDEQQHSDLDALVNEVKRMLNSFISRLY